MASALAQHTQDMQQMQAANDRTTKQLEEALALSETRQNEIGALTEEVSVLKAALASAETKARELSTLKAEHTDSLAKLTSAQLRLALLETEEARVEELEEQVCIHATPQTRFYGLL